MGKIISSIFGGGGSQQSSSQRSWNNAWPQLNSTFAPVTKYAGEAGSAISRLLGGDASDFNKYKDATGFDFAQDRGTQGVLTNMGAQGLRNSGATLKRLSEFNTGLQDQFSGNFIERLLGLAGIGTSAGQILSSAGQESTGQSQGSSYQSKGILNSLMGTPG